MMVVWPKHVVTITSEEEKKNCCVDGPTIALLFIFRKPLLFPRTCFICMGANKWWRTGLLSGTALDPYSAEARQVCRLYRLRLSLLLYSYPLGQFRIRPRIRPLKSFPFHHPLIILPLDHTDSVGKEPTKIQRVWRELWNGIQNVSVWRVFKKVYT
jgi:hypothetical protein